MANPEFYSRIIHKHDTEENWIKATNFIPKQGEMIVYDIDNNHNYERIKIGDGVTNVNVLPFIDKTLADLVGTKNDNETVDTAFGRIAKAQDTAEAAQAAANSHRSFSTIKVKDTSISADSTSDTLTFVEGSNVSITPDAGNDKITINVPTASGTIAGATIVYPAASCTTFSSDSGTVTPLAVQKGAELFAITRPPKRNTSNPANPGAPGTCTTNNIVRWLNTAGDVQDSKIAIEDVTNTKDTSKKAQVITIPAEGNKKMVYGYCTDQVDGTSFLGGLFDADATSYPYAQGLAIGGSSGNLLWKGVKVATTSDIPTTFAASAITSGTIAAARLPAATSSALGGVKVGSNITNSSGTISLTKDNVTAALGYTPPTTDTNTTYSAGTGISLSGTTFSNSGVRSITTGTSNGTISVNTNGTSADVAVKGLGSAAYTNSTAYATAAQGTLASNAMPKAGGSFTGTAYAKSQNTTEGCLRNISIRNAAGNSLISTNYLIMLRK